MNPLAKLQTIYLNDDFAIWVNVNEGVRRVSLGFGLARFLRGQRKIKIQGNQHPARNGCRGTYKAAPTKK